MPDNKKNNPFEQFGGSKIETKNAFSEFGGKLVSSKKKVPSELKSESSSQGTQEMEKPEPSVSSGSENNLYTYSGRPGVIYKKQGNDWYIDLSGAGQNFKKIDNSQRVATLEREAKPAFRPTEEQFSFEQAPKAQKIKTTDKEAQKVFSESFKALDKKDPIVIAREQKDKKIESALSKVNEAIVGSDEEDAVIKMKNVFKTAGADLDMFDFSEEGIGYDKMRIKNKYTGKYIDISLDNWTNERDSEEAKLLKGFIDVELRFADQAKKKKEIQDLYKQMESNPAYAVMTQEKIDELQKEVDIDQRLKENYVLQSNNKYLASAVYNKDKVKTIESKLGRATVTSIDIKQRQKEYQDWKDKADAALKSGTITQEEYDTTYLPKLQEEEKSIQDDANKIVSDLNDIRREKSDLDKIAGLYVSSQEDRGNELSGVASAFAKGFATGATSLPMFFKSLEKGDTTDYAKFMDSIAEETTVGSTSKEYLTSENRDDFTKAILGVVESFGQTAAGGGAIGGLTLFGASYLNFRSEIDSNPELKNINQYEKVLLSAGLAAPMALLEKFGVDTILTKNPIASKVINKILVKTFKSLPKDASKEVLESAIQSNLKAAILEGALTSTEKGLIEATTEAVQTDVELATKAFYNWAKGGDYFETPKTAYEWLSSTGESFKLGLIGGAFVNSTIQVANIPLNNMSMKDIEATSKMIQDDNLRDIIKTSLKAKVATGEMSAFEAKNVINNINDIEGVISKIPSDLSDEAKFQSVKLLDEKSRLQQEIAGKDEALVARQKDRINAINEELKNISNAVTQSTEQQQEGTAEGSVSERQRVDEGQQEVGQGEGSKRETEKPSTDISDSNITSEEALKDVESTARELENVNTQLLKKQLGIDANWDMIGEQDAISGNDPTLAYTQRLLPDWNREHQKGNINTKSKITYDIIRGRFGGEDQKNVAEAKDENGIVIGIAQLDSKGGIEHIAVATEFRGKGVSNKLIETLKQNNPNLDLSKTKLRSKGFEKAFGNKIISEAYHADKDAGKETELTKAVEDLLGNRNIPSEETQVILPTKNKAGEITGYISQVKDADGNVVDIEEKTEAEVQQKIDDIQQTIEQPTFEDAKNLDPKDKLYSKKIYDILEAQKQALIRFSKESTGSFIIPPSVLIKAIEGIQKAVELGMTFENAIREYASKNNLKVEDIENGLYTISEAQKRKTRERLTGEKQPIVRQSKESVEAKELSKRKTKKVIVDEVKSLKDQIKLEAKAAKEGAKSVSDAIKAITRHFNSLSEKDKLNRKDLIKIINLISKVKDSESLNNTIPKLFDIMDNANKNIIEVDEYSALRDQLKLEAKAAKDVKKKQTEMIKAINTSSKTGKISSAKAVALINKIQKTKLESEKSINDFLRYAERVFKDAEYGQKLSDSNSLRKKIRKSIKRDGIQVEVIGVLKAFSKIDPKKVDNIDEYKSYAEQLVDASKATKVDKTTGKPDFKQPAELAKISKYVSEELKRQEEQAKQDLMDEYDSLVEQGLISGNMSLDEMKSYIDSLDTEKEDISEKKETEIRKYTDAEFKQLSTIIKEMISSGKDVFTGEDLDLSEKDIQRLKDIMDINLDELNLKDAFQVVEHLSNFITNGITSNLDNIQATYEGVKNAKAIKSSGIRSYSIKLLFSDKLGRFFGKQTMSLPTFMDNIFGGEKRSLFVAKAMGLTGLMNSKSKAIVRYREKMAQHKAQFEKKRPNNKNFNASENIYERGVFAYLLRNSLEGDKKMFTERVSNTLLTIDKLLNSKDKNEVKKGEVLNTVAEKLGLRDENVSIESVTDKVDDINKEDVNWWINTWGEIYDELYDVSLAVYNVQLSPDAFYTTDTISDPDRTSSLMSDDNLSGLSRNLSISPDDKRTGVLRENNRHKVTEKGKTLINFNFDSNQDRAFKAALVDMYTAKDIKQIKSFLKSDSFKEIMDSKDDAELLALKVANSIKRSKGKSLEESDQIAKDAEKLANRVAALGTSMVLGRPSQLLLQTTPVLSNTLLNTGDLNIRNMFDRDAAKFIAESGRGIALRGKESLSMIESFEKYLDRNPDSTYEKFAEKFDNLNNWWLDKFLVKSDVFTANASWLAYYEKSLRDQGVHPGGKIDWANHKLNEEAADYAQHKIDRQQNISDPDFGGELFTSKNPYTRMIVKAVMPFSNFIMNQKSRMYADIKAIRRGDSAERVSAIKSLSGLGVESLVYRAIASVIGYSLWALANGDASDEDKEKKKQSAINNAISSSASDILSLAPALNSKTIQALNALSGLSQKYFKSDEVDAMVEDENKRREAEHKPKMGEAEEDEFRRLALESLIFSIKEYEAKDDGLGVFGIAMEKRGVLYDLINKRALGEYMDENPLTGVKTKKYLIKKDQEKMTLPLMLESLHTLRLIPQEVSRYSSYLDKKISNNSLSAKQFDKYNELKKVMELDTDKQYVIDAIKSTSNIQNTIHELNYIESKGGMTNKEYSEMLILKKQFGKKALGLIDEVKAGKTAKEILKR